MRRYKTFDAYRKAWDQADKITPVLPLNVDIELSSVCNLKCPFCFVSNPEYKNITHNFMPVEMAEQIIGQCADIGVPALKFNWRGEPTLHPLFGHILKKASEHDFHELIVNTNGNYYGEAVRDGLVRATKVIFSVDSFNEGTYREMRRGGSLSRLLRNIHEMIAAGHRGIVVRRVVTDLNRHENFADDARLLFGNKVKVSEHEVFDRSGGTERGKAIKRVYCGYPSQRLVIDVDGHYHPCCVDTWEQIKLGGITGGLTIQHRWRYGCMQTLRDTLKKNKFMEYTCENCTSWMAYDTKYRDMVKK